MTPAGGALRIPEGVVWNRVVDEAVLLNLRSSTYYMLNESGARMLELIAEHGEPFAVVEALEGHYNDADRETLVADLGLFIDELVAAGLLVRSATR
jgi:hypothetical protein